MASTGTVGTGVGGGRGRVMTAPTSAPASSASRLSPPFRLPGAHYAAAMVFLVLGVAGLAWVSPDLAAGRYLSPRAVAVTHLFTLGWITLSIFGSLYQFLPVALGDPIRSQRLAHGTLVVFVPGLLLFVSGLAGGASWAVIAGSALFSVGMLGFCANLAATLKRAGRRDLTWWSLSAAVTYLFLTVVLGLLLAVNLRSGFMGAGRWPAFGVHVHMALAGWVLLVVIGVAHRLLPMFLLSHGAPEGWGRASAWLAGSGVALLVAFHHAPPLAAQWIPATLIAGGLAAFLVQAALYFRGSVRPRLDPGLRMAGAGLVVLTGGLALGAWAMVAGWQPAALVAGYGVAVILALSLFVAAHYYKIVPFLVWYHRFGPLVGQRPVPQVSQLYSSGAASVAGVLMTAGFCGVIVAVLLGAGTLARAAALVALLGVLIEAAQMAILARRRAE